MLKLKSLCLVLALLAAGFASTGRAEAASRAQIDAEVNATLNRFFATVSGGREMANRAEALLIFPEIVKAGIGIGGEYGEGALHIRGRTAGYYNLISASFGFQLGIQTRSVVIMFMTPAALAGFQARAGWEIGVDGSVALITVGAGGAIDTNNVLDPIVGFIFNNKGLMYNLTLEGSKITEIQPY